jgi:hypothetical protein
MSTIGPAAALLETDACGLYSLWNVLNRTHFNGELPVVPIEVTADVLPPGRWDGEVFHIPKGFFALGPDDAARALSFSLLHLAARIQAVEIANANNAQDECGIIFRMVATGISRRIGWPDVKPEDMGLWPFTNDLRLIEDVAPVTPHMLN